MDKRKLLILCTGNSCRSQMAEGLINHDHGDEWVAYSAGTQPAGYVHPHAIQVMSELGIDIGAATSKSTDRFRDAHFDLVVTVCDDAAKGCPTWFGAPTVHVGFEDPARFQGPKVASLAVFRRVRDEIRQRLPQHLFAYHRQAPLSSSPPILARAPSPDPPPEGEGAKGPSRRQDKGTGEE